MGTAPSPRVRRSSCSWSCRTPPEAYARPDHSGRRRLALPGPAGACGARAYVVRTPVRTRANGWPLGSGVDMSSAHRVMAKPLAMSSLT